MMNTLQSLEPQWTRCLGWVELDSDELDSDRHFVSDILYRMTWPLGIWKLEENHEKTD